MAVIQEVRSDFSLNKVLKETQTTNSTLKKNELPKPAVFDPLWQNSAATAKFETNNPFLPQF
jgi:hypothetical protein